MKKKYTDEDLLEALRKESKDGLMGPTYHQYLQGKNRPSAEAIRARFGGWTVAVRKAGMIPAARRTKREMRKLVKLGKVDPKYPALRMGMSVRELKVSVGLEKPRKPTRERYIDEGVRIARKLGRAPNFHEFNRYTRTVTAWNPYRLYGRDWQAFKRDVEKRLKEKEKEKARRAAAKGGKKAAAKSVKKTAKKKTAKKKTVKKKATRKAKAKKKTAKKKTVKKKTTRKAAAKKKTAKKKTAKKAKAKKKTAKKKTVKKKTTRKAAAKKKTAKKAKAKKKTAKKKTVKKK